MTLHMMTTHSSLGRRLACLLIGCLLAATLQAQDDSRYQTQKDSLWQRVETTQGAEKLEAWHEFVLHIFYDEGPDVVTAHLASYEQACLDQQNVAGAARCRGNVTLYYYTHDLYDEVAKRADDDLQFIASQQDWNTYFKTYKNVVMSNFYICTFNYYNGIKDYDRLEAYCREVEQRPDMMTYRTIKTTILFSHQQIALSRGQYQQAYDCAEQLLALRTGEQDVYGQFTSYRDMVDALAYLNRGDDCTVAFAQALALKDSIAKTDFHAQLDELRTVYEVDKHIAEKEHTRLFLFFALGVCCLLALVLGIWIHFSCTITRKNRVLAQQIHELTEQQEVREQEILNKTTFLPPPFTNGHPPLKDDDCLEVRKDRLCIAIRDLMLREKVYRDPNISRDQVIERLGTNRELFLDAFQYCFHMSFPEYINSLRLKEAVQILEDPALAIESISERSGFGTIRTFQRQFQAKYNMSPKNYREMLQATLQENKV